MSSERKFNRPWVLGAATLAFSAALGLGYYAASARDGGRASSEADSAGLSLIYKIPVTISQPSTGPEDALVTIVQWCDLPDAACQQSEPFVQALLKRYPKDLRLVFRHYMRPDQPGSSNAHQFARMAHEQGAKFWQARKLLLAHQGPVTDADLERFAGKLGLDWSGIRKALDARTFGSAVTADRVFAAMFEVKRTPAFFANGHPLLGAVTEQSLEQLVQAELARAKEVVAKGVGRTELYEELIKHGTWTPPPRPDAPNR